MLTLRELVATLALTAGLLGGCAHRAAAPPPAPPAPVVEQVGTASYLDASFAGRRTAAGRPYDPERLVAAHRTLPFGTRIRVTNLGNGRSATLTVVDRGPFRAGRILDVSPRAARTLGFYRAGLARVRVEVVSVPDQAEADPR